MDDWLYNVDLAQAPIPLATHFHVIDAHTSYHVHFRWPWIHKHRVVIYIKFKSDHEIEESSCECIRTAIPEE